MNSPQNFTVPSLFLALISPWSSSSNDEIKPFVYRVQAILVREAIYNAAGLCCYELQAKAVAQSEGSRIIGY